MAQNVLVPNFRKEKGSKKALVTVVVQDRITREILMLAYTDREGFIETLKTDEAVYWSRSRKERWKKGESSGCIQRVCRVMVDCDGDAVIYLVDQEGVGACHTGQRTCFYRSVIGSILETKLPKSWNKFELLDVHPSIMF